MKNKSTISFFGGAGSVTGANFLFESSGKKILIDCGLFQGSFGADGKNREAFSYNPSEIDILFITHAHMDHIGRVPKLVKDGFRGQIISTQATKEISEFMFDDAYSVMKHEEARKGPPMYEIADIKQTLSLWKGVCYGESISITEGLFATFKNSGHILGSAMIEFAFGNKKVVFTGDLGNSPSPLLCDTEKVTDANFLIMESVYGDRNHEPKDLRNQKLEKVIKDNISRKGTLLIPSFSLERTQVILYEINNLIESGKIGAIPVFLDSPLAIKITDVYKRFTDDLNKNVQEAIKKGDDIFNFPKLKYTLLKQDASEIEKTKGPKIIIAGSGMSVGGRIVSHEKECLPNPNNTILIVGYQEVGTLGRRILDGERTVKIHGEDVKVRAKVEFIEGYSSHKDSDNLIDFVSDTASTLQKVFVVMGETKSALFLAQRLHDYLDVNAVAPQAGEKEEIDF